LNTVKIIYKLTVHYNHKTSKNFGSLEYPDIEQTTTVLWATAVCNLVAG